MTLQHIQLQQAEFGTGQTGQVFATKTFTTTEGTEIQKQHKHGEFWWLCWCLYTF